MRVVFFGTPRFGATILEYLIQHSVNVIAVVSRPDKPKGRSGKPQPTPVKQVAQRYQISVHQPKKTSTSEFTLFLTSLEADFFIVAAYAEILKENILSIPKLGCLNVHGSLLPKYRGAAPIQRALMAGEEESGVSIMKMVLEMDAGDIYSTVKVQISEEVTAGELFDKMSLIGSRALLDVMKKIENKEIEAIAQDHTQATFSKKLTSRESEINWNNPAYQIHNQIRGLTPNPGAWCWVELRGVKKRCKIKKTRLFSHHSGRPGDLVLSSPKLIVICGKGSLELLEIQLEGKKILSAEVFLLGTDKKNLNF